MYSSFLYITGKYHADVCPKKDFIISGQGQKYCQLIYNKLKIDLSHMKFNISLTYNNEILIQFYILPIIFTRIEYDHLTHYLSTMVKHGLGLELGLRKRGDRWGRLEAIPIDTTTNNSNDKVTDTDPHSSSTKNNNNNNNTNAPTHYLSYSMYTSWVPTAVLTVHKATSQFDRERTRAKIEYAKERELS